VTYFSIKEETIGSQENCFIKVLVTVIHNFLKTKIVALPCSLEEWRGMNDICHSPK
jgi:hypothetical protein